ncbi:putative bifunctional diguanylate cyclase/phosphodiesterase [Kangiella koreensis]|uniref:Diguanylate cyclase/phosphodiesterase n=1 Tax=Kangiella koreensis (strain DSM 16069 / JCM 12317 / KCTC 12182 / SW-125) TaxID=523791 RepID=C7RD26_KANKD|nr:GGDEF domain-containing phosphodiesterase [Kangiella koreensis]ACV27168.1 diguanylate cyclase/phosphodiesterase [Kangiella koreensis DSM 16069]
MQKKKFVTAFRGTLIYAVIGGLWILFSDKAVEALFDDSTMINLMQTYKGWFYVLVTAVLLFILLRRAVEDTEKLLTLDPVTQLPRHYQFTRLLDKQLSNLPGNKVLILIYLDINRFSQLNQEFGHQAGDRVLQKITSQLWEYFHDNSLMGRLGSDQFGLAVTIDNDRDIIDNLPELVFRQLHKASETLQIPFKLSMGVAIAPTDGSQSKSLLSAASVALHNAKIHGEEQYSFFSRELSEIAQLRQNLINELKKSELFQHFHIVYQPQLSISTRKVVGVEVLLRWIHPELDFIPPDQFIPVAEDIGLMPDITRWVITNAKKELSDSELIPSWVDRVSINISAKELNIEEQVKNLHDIFQEYHSFAKICQLEITETTAIYDISTSQKFIKSLKKLGLRFSIDDFGTGFTSLSNLKNLPVDELKVDRSFIDKIETEHNSQIIVKSIVDLAKNFGINSVAEGVENENQLNFLKQCGCKEAQGYYFAKPMGVDDLEKYLKGKLG